MEEQEETNECNYCSAEIDINKKWCNQVCFKNDLKN